MGFFFKVFMSENIINNKMIENGRFVIIDVVCKFLRLFVIVIVIEIVLISRFYRILCFKVGLIELFVVIFVIICVVELVFVIIKMKISIIVKELVIFDNGKCDNNLNKVIV